MTGSPLLLEQLEDATLQVVHLEWAPGEVRLEVSAVVAGANTRVVLRGSEVSMLACPRRAPWGFSAAIKELRTSSTLDGSARLEVELKSGDVVVVEAKAITVERAA